MHKMANKLRRRIFVLTSFSHSSPRFPFLPFLRFLSPVWRCTRARTFTFLLHFYPLQPEPSYIVCYIARNASILESIDFHAPAIRTNLVPHPRRERNVHEVSARKLAYSPHLWQYRLYATPEIFIGASVDFQVKDYEWRDIGREEKGTAGF